MIYSPVAVATWDLFFNIHSNEIEDYFLESFKILSKMVDGCEYYRDRRDAKEWLNEVQDAIYRTEDFVDKIRSEALNDRLDATSPTKKGHKIRFRSMWVRNLPFWPKQTRKVKKGIRREAKKIVDEFKSLETQGRALDLRPHAGSYYGFLHWERNRWNDTYQKELWYDIDRYRRLSTFFVADSEVFRRDRDEEAIIELLLSDDGSGERLSVIPIVAEDGMGKTALARRVYDNHRVSEHFGLKAWTWFPGKYDLLRGTKAIFELFTSQSCDLEELTSLQHRLCEILRNKKFLIVLDNVLVDNYAS